MPVTNMPSNATYMAHMLISACTYMSKYVSRYMLHMSPMQSEMCTDHWYTFHIIGICPWTNMLATLNCISHCIGTIVYIQTPLLHISVKNKKLQYLFIVIAIHVPETDMPLKCQMSKLLNVHQWGK